MPEMEKGRPPENKRSRKPAHPVKRDVTEEMKSFAESTMSDLLGWYTHHKPDLKEHKHATQNKIAALKKNLLAQQQDAEKKMEVSSSKSKTNDRKGSGVVALFPPSSHVSPKEQKVINVVVPVIKPSAVEERQGIQIVCVWCQKDGTLRYSLLMGSEVKSFCSEKCFAACRRAYFKRNKAKDEDRQGDQSPPPLQTLDTPSRLLLKINNNNNSSTCVCDWCKHVRHTEEYLDVGSGEERLQFCSSKCLNQYKMDVFYREAQAALTGSSSSSGSVNSCEENHTKANAGDKQKLLTPEAWDSSSSKTPAKTPPPASSSSSAQRSPNLDLPCPLVCQPPHKPRPPFPSPPRNHTHPISLLHRNTHTPSVAASHTLPLIPPHPATYVPIRPPLPSQMPPPWPQPMVLLPYPVLLPIPVPIPIPVPLSPQTGVIRSTKQLESEPELFHAGPEDSHAVKMEQSTSPVTSSSVSERQVIQCVHRFPLKEERPDSTTHVSHVPQHHPAPSLSESANPDYMSSLAHSCIALSSLDAACDSEDVKENSYVDGSEKNLTSVGAAEMMYVKHGQSHEARRREEEHGHSVLLKLREKSSPMNFLEKNLHVTTAAVLTSESSRREDPEPAVKRRCLRIRDQNM